MTLELMMIECLLYSRLFVVLAHLSPLSPVSNTRLFQRRRVSTIGTPGKIIYPTLVTELRYSVPFKSLGQKILLANLLSECESAAMVTSKSPAPFGEKRMNLIKSLSPLKINGTRMGSVSTKLATYTNGSRCFAIWLMMITRRRKCGSYTGKWSKPTKVMRRR
jgi:hypothetical protein